MGALVTSVGLVMLNAATAQADPPPPHKSYVCKYVGTPGPDEVLQTGQNPIWVDNHSLVGKDEEVNVGDEFSDAHGFSRVVIANTDRLDPEPGIEICGGTEPEQPDPLVESSTVTDLTCELATETTTTTTTEYVFDEGEWVLGEPETVVSSSTRAPTVEEIASLGEECIAGEETIVPKPKPDKKPTKATDEPTVKGVQVVAPPAAAPTAVAAGLGGPATGPLQTIAQMLVAGGMLLLMAGAWIGLGRRESGTHEA